MFVILWEFEVKPGNQVAFENAYGPGSAWVQLFKRVSHFRGTQLLQDSSRSRYYFTLDFWDSENNYKQFQNSNRDAYNQLDRSFEDLTRQERHILSFNVDPALFAAR